MKIISWEDFINSREPAPQSACADFKPDSASQTACADSKFDATFQTACSDGKAFCAESALTIGVFDGIHIGHKLLLDDVISAKSKFGYEAGIVTFTDSIFKLFKSNEKPLQSIEKRLRRFESLGFDFVILIDFTEKTAGILGTDFLETLKEKCGLKYLVEGEDFRFGRGGETGMAEIKSFCEKNGIEVKFIPPVIYDGERVSSSLIRLLLKRKDFESANRLLGI